MNESGKIILEAENLIVLSFGMESGPIKRGIRAAADNLIKIAGNLQVSNNNIGNGLAEIETGIKEIREALK